MPITHLARTAILLPALLIAAGCSTVEETGRKRIMLMSESQEQKLGADAYQEVLSSEPLSTDARMTAIVRRVGQRIADAANKPDFQWEFNLIESDSVNAFCLPGGKIAVYTGILPVMANEAGMAAVMGHEVAHATLRHGGERASQSMSVQVLDLALSTGLGQLAPGYKSAAMQAFGAGTKYGVLLPFSREHESEADRIGLRYAARAGYDPREAVAFWERMSAQSSGKTPEFMSTHPSHERRITKLQEYMPEAVQLYEQSSAKYGRGESWAGQ